MCGIFGFITGEPSKEHFDILCKLAEESAIRGTDATGVAYFVPKERKYYIHKNNVDSGEFEKDVMKGLKTVISKTPVCIGHVRKWTIGKPDDNNNNHPIFSKDYIMVHNGHVPKTPEIENYKYQGAVDTERMLAQIQTHGLKDGLEKSEGTAAIALLNRRPKQKEILLYRHSNPLWLAYKPDTKTVFFASTEDILDDSLNTDYYLSFFRKRDYLLKEIPADEVYKLVLRDDGTPTIEFVQSVKLGDQFSYVEHYAKERKEQETKGITGDGTKVKVTDRRRYKPVNEVIAEAKGETPNSLVEYPQVDVDEERKVHLPKLGWVYDRDAKIWCHKHMRACRTYDFENQREIACTPEAAVKYGWAECVPEMYQTTYQRAAKASGPRAADIDDIKKLNKEKSCVICRNAGADNCVRCKDKSHFRGTE